MEVTLFGTTFLIWTMALDGTDINAHA